MKSEKLFDLPLKSYNSEHRKPIKPARPPPPKPQNENEMNFNMDHFGEDEAPQAQILEYYLNQPYEIFNCFPRIRISSSNLMDV